MNNSRSKNQISANCSVTIVGAGKVGQSLAQLFENNDISVELLNRHYLENTDIIASSNILIISVVDGAIEDVCKSIIPHIKPNTIITHCSGALDSNILESAKKLDCYIASTHPLNTFPTLDAALETFDDNKHDSYLMAEGDMKALETLLPLFDKIGFQTLRIETKNKAAYHAATVFACNYLTTLMDLSLQSAELAGIEREQFWPAIQPLITATLGNIQKHGTANALSGPIARSDTLTLEKHLSAFKTQAPNLHQAYCDFALRTIELAAERNELNTSEILTMKEMMK